MKITGIKNIKGNYKLIKARENLEKSIEGTEENKKSEYEVGCFQLVVIEKTSWYKKIFNFLKKICLKEITIKI